MSQSNNIQYKIYNIKSSGFTLVEVVAALVLLGLLLGSTLTLMNRYVDTIIDMRLRQQAFETARANMELLLSENSLSDTNDYGTDEFNPDLDWEVVVEPFYEPVTERMWIRAVCTSGFLDTKGERQEVELEHWITNLTPEQIKQIKAQQKAEQEYMELLQGGEVTDQQKATAAFLIQEGLDIGAYHKFLKQQLRQKLEYLSNTGFDGYEDFVRRLEEEENIFLQKLGMDFDRYNEFAQDFDSSIFDPTDFTLNPKTDRSDRPDQPDSTDPSDLSDPSDLAEPENQNKEPKPNKPKNDKPFDWSKVPPELEPIVEKLTGQTRPK